MTIRAMVLAGFGQNCEWETAHALRLAGAETQIVHISELTGTSKVNPTETLDKYHILVFGGGFAWADDHGAGVILATKIGNHLRTQLHQFLDRGGLVLGICNGFQALVNLGILPMLQGTWERQVALMANQCGNFQDRWVDLVVEPESPCIFTKNIKVLPSPVRHGEGRFVCRPDALKQIEDMGLVAVRYGTASGRAAQGDWPQNPNGSLNDIAGICDPSGRVFGLMPHPEGYYRASQHPDWTFKREKLRRRGRELDPMEPGLGLTVFKNAVANVQRGA